MRLAVIIPVYNDSTNLSHCLKGLRCSSEQPDEIVVVNDSSTDNSSVIAQNAGVKLLTLAGGPRGPARARNRGAQMVEDADILFFLDSDVVVHPDTISRARECFEKNANLAALFGSYDDSPLEINTVSQYRNLLHHYIHQNSRSRATTFWTGCGAIRRRDFEEIGGFDESFAKPSVEDIELGMRLSAKNAEIELNKKIQVQHRKRWGLLNLIETDVFRRAVPWTRLMLDKHVLDNTLNLSLVRRIDAVIAMALTVCFPFVFVTKIALFLFLISGLIFTTINFRLFGLLYRKGGIRLLAPSILLHILYNNYSLATFVIMQTMHCINRLASRKPIEVNARLVPELTK